MSSGFIDLSAGGSVLFYVVTVYCLVSGITFIVYAFDKSAARTNQGRTPEVSLHLLSLCGGWPGALVAQRVLRHKSRKISFQVAFWATVIVNCIMLAWLLV